MFSRLIAGRYAQTSDYPLRSAAEPKEPSWLKRVLAAIFGKRGG